MSYSFSNAVLIPWRTSAVATTTEGRSVVLSCRAELVATPLTANRRAGLPGLGTHTG